MVQILNGLLPNCVLRRGIVLQYWILYCRDLGFEGKVVLQYWLLGVGLCHNTVHCIVTEARHGLYCNTVTVPMIQQGHGRWAGAGRAGGRWASVRAGRAGRARGWACWALGRQALGREGRAGARSACGHAAGRDAGVGAQGHARRGSRRADTAWTREARGWRRQERAGLPAGRACARSMGVLAGSAGPSWCTVHLAQF